MITNIQALVCTCMMHNILQMQSTYVLRQYEEYGYFKSIQRMSSVICLLAKTVSWDHQQPYIINWQPGKDKLCMQGSNTFMICDISALHGACTSFHNIYC